MSEKKSRRTRKIVLVILFGGAIPFFLWGGVRGEVLLKAYILTALIAFMIFGSYWAFRKERWLWEAVSIIAPLHLGIVFSVVLFNLDFPQIDHLPRITYTILSLLFFIEASIARRIIEYYRRKAKVH